MDSVSLANAYSIAYLFPKLSNATDVFFFFFSSYIVWLVICRCIHFQVQGVHGIIHVIEGTELDEVAIGVTQKDLKLDKKMQEDHNSRNIAPKGYKDWLLIGLCQKLTKCKISPGRGSNPRPSKAIGENSSAFLPL